jgi:hypothetical protein
MRATRILTILFGIAALAFALSTQANAHTPHPGLDFSIGVDTVGGPADDCGTDIGQNTKCAIEAGGTFRLNIYLNALGGIAEYGGFDLIVGFAGVESKDTPDANVWPDCFTEAMNTSFPGLEALGCAVEPPNDVLSSYTGLVGTMDFNCNESGTVELLHGNGNTALVNGNITSHHEASGGSEALTINCFEPPVGGISRAAAAANSAPEQQAAAEGALGLATIAGAMGAAALAVLLRVLAAGRLGFARR